MRRKNGHGARQRSGPAGKPSCGCSARPRSDPAARRRNAGAAKPRSRLPSEKAERNPSLAEAGDIDSAAQGKTEQEEPSPITGKHHAVPGSVWVVGALLLAIAAVAIAALASAQAAAERADACGRRREPLRLARLPPLRWRPRSLPDRTAWSSKCRRRTNGRRRVCMFGKARK